MCSKRKPVTTIDEKGYSRLFKAFGDPTRIRILHILSAGEKTVNEIVELVDASQPTVSRHLGIMRDAGIVESRRDGQRIFYSLEKNTVRACCAGFCDCLIIDIGDGAKKNS